MDQAQSKAREIDLIAEKSVSIRDHFGKLMGNGVVRLCIECKFIAATSVFWFTDKDTVSAQELVCRSGKSLRDSAYTNNHHYLSTCQSVAKIFQTESKSQEQEPIYKALNQVLSAHVNMRKRPLADPSLRTSSGGIRFLLNYPVVVCSDFSRLYRTEFFEDAEPVTISDNFQLEVQYAFAESTGSVKDEYFLIDFVAFELLDDFLEKVIHNAEVLASILKYRP